MVFGSSSFFIVTFPNVSGCPNQFIQFSPEVQTTSNLRRKNMQTQTAATHPTTSTHKDRVTLEQVKLDAQSKITRKDDPAPVEPKVETEEPKQPSPRIPKFESIEIKSLPIASINVDEEIQQRIKTSKGTIKDYARLLKEDHTFPAITVFMNQTENEEPEYYLADGFHRLQAYQNNGKEEIPCEIYKGSKLVAKFYAAGCNGTHGLKRSNQDKKKAVTTVLTDSTWKRMTDSEIAKHCHVSQPFVGKIRKKIDPNSANETKRITKAGREIETKNIGRSNSQSTTTTFNTAFTQEVSPDQYDPVGIDILKLIQNLYNKLNEKPKDKVFLLKTFHEHLEACRNLLELDDEELVDA